MRATDEQIERVRAVQNHYVLNDETVEAFDAVLSELTASRKLRDALLAWQRAGEGSLEAEEVDAALAEARK